MNQPETPAPADPMNSHKDEALAETNATRYEEPEKPRSFAWLVVDILVVLLVLAYFVIILRIKAGIF